MRTAILTDTHFGARNDSQQFLDYFLGFIENQFLPLCKEQGISTIIHLGDLMDRRKFVNFNTLNQVRQRFIEKLEEMDITMYCLIGNHDTYYKNTNEINSLKELFGDRYTRFVVIENPSEIEIGNKVFGLVPWINKENKEECDEFLKNTHADIVCGHFELRGYEVMRGVQFDGGMDDNLLRRFDRVWSGHFHTRHTKNNIQYLGTPYQITFADLHESKGFYVYDTETDQMDFVFNEDKMYLHINYTDDLILSDLSKYENKYLKIFVAEKKSQTKLDTLVDNLYDAKVASVTIVENETTKIEDNEIADMTLDTLALIYKEAEDFYAQMEEINVSKLKNLIQDIYMEAISQ